MRGVGLCVPQSLGQLFETVIVGWQWRVAVSASFTRGSLYLAEGLRSLFFVDSGRVVGDIIIYEIGSDHNGKARAVNAKIEGVQQVLTLTPIQSRPQINNTCSPRTTDVIYRRNTVNSGKPKKHFNLLPILFFTIIAVYLYDKVSKEKIQIDLPKLLEVDTNTVKTQQFQCQGKIWCSQMSSYEEAMFYLNNVLALRWMATKMVSLVKVNSKSRYSSLVSFHNNRLNPFLLWVYHCKLVTAQCHTEETE